MRNTGWEFLIKIFKHLAQRLKEQTFYKYGVMVK